MPKIYAPSAGATQFDSDGHGWYSPYFSVSDVAVSRVVLMGTRQMTLLLEHTNTSTDERPASYLSAATISTAPLEVVVNGLDGHGDVSKYALGVEHRVPPALVSFSIPSAACVAGAENDGGPYPLSQQYPQSQCDELGAVDAPGGVSASESCFYSNRYVYGMGFRSGYVDRPDKAHMLEILFRDAVVSFNGHGTYQSICNQMGVESVTSISIQRYYMPDPNDPSEVNLSDAKFVLLECCYAASTVDAQGNPRVSPADALDQAGVDCVIGWITVCPPDHPGCVRLFDLVCVEGMTVGEAYDQVCQEYSTWASGTRIMGGTPLWGVPL